MDTLTVPRPWFAARPSRAELVRPAEVVPLLRCDQEIHDATSLPVAESLDPWLVNGYIRQRVPRSWQSAAARL
jgi:hypothetical protein